MFLRAGFGGLEVIGGIEGLCRTGCFESGLVPRLTRKVFVRTRLEAAPLVDFAV